MLILKIGLQQQWTNNFSFKNWVLVEQNSFLRRHLLAVPSDIILWLAYGPAFYVILKKRKSQWTLVEVSAPLKNETTAWGKYLLAASNFSTFSTIVLV